MLSNRGHAQFLKEEGASTVSLDQHKIDMAARWDGLHGVIVSDPDIDPKTVMAQYRGLWQVEETFRISKHGMRMRPIFHWTTKRIRAHIALCYMTLTCAGSIEQRIRLQYKRLSPKEISITSQD